MQDLGFFIESGDIESGLVIAESPTKNTTGIGAILLGVSSRENTRATAFIETFSGELVRIRLSFALVSSRNAALGSLLEEGTILYDPDLYKLAFHRIDEAIYTRKNMLVLQ